METPKKRNVWIGRIVTGAPVLFLAWDVAMKLVGSRFVDEASIRLGLPVSIAPVLGVVLLACLALYLVPRTAVIGAVLTTGYLGGAVLAHLRIDDPLASHTFFPIYIGTLLWTGLYLRDARVRNLIAAR